MTGNYKNLRSEYLVESDWLEVTESAAGDLLVKSYDGHTVVLDPTLDPELRTEGMAR